jgi:BASS family bile acid:Na+ symporter
MFFEKKIIFILLANIVIWFLAYYLVRPYNPDLAFILFLVWITPTATAAPWVISILWWKVSFVVASVLLTNIFMAFSWPFFFQYTWYWNIDILPVLVATLTVIMIPLVLAQFFHFIFPKGREFLLTKVKFFSFYIWLWIIGLSVSRASTFIANQSQVWFFDIAQIFIGVLILCAIHFTLWRFIWKKEYWLEASQSLWQKNTIFSMWVALQFFTPLIALGPIFYIIFHNLYNAYLLHMKEK